MKAAREMGVVFKARTPNSIIIEVVSYNFWNLSDSHFETVHVREGLGTFMSVCACVGTHGWAGRWMGVCVGGGGGGGGVEGGCGCGWCAMIAVCICRMELKRNTSC